MLGQMPAEVTIQFRQWLTKFVWKTVTSQQQTKFTDEIKTRFAAIKMLCLFL